MKFRLIVVKKSIIKVLIMSSKIKYFIGNWKMFGVPSLSNIIDKINRYFVNDSKHNIRYRIVFAPPFTLLHDFSNKF